MDDGQEIATDEKIPFYGDHRFLAMITMSIITSIILIIVGLLLYGQSGAAQLDLSRPGYKDIRAEVVVEDDSFTDFSSLGGLNTATFDSFILLYTQQAEKAKIVDAYGGDPLNPGTLWSSTNLGQ